MKDLIKKILEKNILIQNIVEKYDYRRFLYQKIEVKRPFKSILGLRGVGKTTLLAQLAQENDGLYISLDDIELRNINLLELLLKINEDYGFNNFFLDEIQSLLNWEYYLKDLFELSKFNIIFSGSSLIDLKEKSVDLSRRVINYEISPLSFREYILFKKNVNIEKISFDALIDFDKRKKYLRKVLPHMNLYEKYLEFGAYPFMLESGNVINSFRNILEKTFYQDFVKIKQISEEDVNYLFKIVKYIASGTDEISYNNLSNDLKVSKNKIYSLFELLEKSQLVIKVEPKLLGRKLLRKHPKYFMLLPIRNLINEINGFKTEIGNLREDFFITSMFNNLHQIKYIKTNIKQPDFYFNNYIFEIGGKGKTRKQIKEFEKSFVVKDGFENSKNVIPLILFGFLF